MRTAENRWSEDDTLKLKKLRAEGRSAANIARAFPERSYNAVRRKIEGLRAEEVRGGKAIFDRWSEEDLRRLENLHASGLRGAVIAAHFPERTYAAVQQRLNWLKNKRAAADGVAASPPPKPGFFGSPPTSITAFVCGDPPPGRSALDQKTGRA